MDIFIENKQLDDARATVIAFNKLMIQNVERAFNLQVTSLKAYTRTYLDNFSAGLELRDMDDFNTLFEQQKNIGREISDLWVADINACGELFSKFFDDSCDLADTNSIVAPESPKVAVKPSKAAVSTTKTMEEPVKAAEKPAGVATKPPKAAVSIMKTMEEPVKAAEKPAGVATKPPKAAVSTTKTMAEAVKAAEKPAGVAAKPSKVAASPARTTSEPDG